jgi:hypothetical protein
MGAGGPGAPPRLGCGSPHHDGRASAPEEVVAQQVGFGGGALALHVAPDPEAPLEGLGAQGHRAVPAGLHGEGLPDLRVGRARRLHALALSGAAVFVGAGRAQGGKQLRSSHGKSRQHGLPTLSSSYE